MKTTQEKNRMIAEFMGGLTKDKMESLTKNEIWIPKYGVCMLYNGSPAMKYHTSWEWLMPVVDKIEDLGCKFDMFPSKTKKKYYIATLMTYVNNTFKLNKSFAATGDTRIQPVYDVVVQFIEWYNENK